MNVSIHIALERLACLFVSVLLCSASSHLLAQQSILPAGLEPQTVSELDTKQIVLTLEDKPLSDILAALSDQIGYGIVMDGKPLVTRGRFNLHTSAKTAIDTVCESFDCNWKVGKSGAILMFKRFHQPGDLPQIHLKEMQKMAADLLAIWPENASTVRMSRYPFVTASIAPGNALFRTFTREQLKMAQLTFQDLSAEQKNLARLCILNGASGESHDIWEGLNARLAGMPYSSLQWRSWFHNQLDQHPTRFQYSLEYAWPDLQDKGYERLIPAQMFYEATEKVKK